MSFWIPNVDACELPGTREMFLELSNQESASVHLVIPEAQIGAARFWGLRNGGRPHPQHEGLFLASIDVRYDYPKEFAGNAHQFYQDDCIAITLNYRAWQLPNQGYESVLENIGQVQTVPLRGLYWAMPGNFDLGNLNDPVTQDASMFIRRGNLRITRTYTGRTRSPLFIQAYHNTINANPLTVLEWGITIPPEHGMFTVGNFSRSNTRDFSSSNPAARIDMFTFSYSIEIMEGGWNTLYHPAWGSLFPVFNRAGQRVSFYPNQIWNLVSLLE